ncbi:MAG: transposase, partial [Candidatus Saccharimonadales bacterium]
MQKWQQTHLEYCYEPLLSEKWILDIDTTIKTLFGHQEGAEVGYNPTKPGRPAHIIHTYMMSETRLILDSEVLPGKQNASSYTLPRLLEFIDGLSSEKHPSLTRGDCAFGNEPVLGGLEQRGMNYLFKIRQTKRVKELIDLCNRSEKFWTDAGQGWEGTAAELQLSGWSKKRHVIVLRRRCEKKRGRKPKTNQLLLPFLGAVLD